MFFPVLSYELIVSWEQYR